MEYIKYEAGFFFTPVESTGLLDQYDCYVVHSSLKYQRGLGYPGRLERFSRLGEVHVIVHARNRRVAEKKVRRLLRKHYRKNR
ncbi:hypothetical protein HWB76_gp048 [Streptomyces phage Blueeyedbeauty]|uniref:Uncharacterized protein n=1 Tax=Streptomyces phage Blueeyedbeauty TaxID=2250336 RepID=A0A345L250_9CAUD|nr:hypothetical protein HWB76_gp048 [Streptomyces phage Blueeyedbeauty]AXH49352.1 hypothetical protein SEA_BLUEEYEDBEAUTY_245 [Streptomyces phage Blueeyedbeauty]